MKYEIKKEVEKHQYTSDEKKSWFGYGEWVEEPDVIAFTCMGYNCVVRRVVQQEPFTQEEVWFGGHLCGYVEIPKDHPLFGQKNRDIHIDCHGGITYSEAHEDHIIGFDCGHSHDFIPSIEYMKNNNPEIRKMREIFPLPPGFENFALFHPVYRNIDFCIEQCVDMVDQLINIKVTNTINNAATATEDMNEEKEDTGTRD